MIDIVEVSEAYRRYRELTKSPSNINTMRRFSKFLELPEWCMSMKHLLEIIETSDTAHTRIRWLNSPQADVYYKIWKAKNG